MKISARHILPWLLLAAACCVPAKQSERKPALPPPKPVRVRLLFGGDVMQHLPQVTAARRETGFDYREVFAHLHRRFRAADLVIVNLETTLTRTDRYTGYPCFRSPAALADALRDAGVDVAVLANNHCCDGGAAGVHTTVAELRRCGIRHTGVFTDSLDRAANNPLWLEHCGVRFALLNYTYGTNGLPIPAENPWATMLLDEGKVGRDLEIARETADMVVVLPHWGNEYVTEPSSYQRQWAQFLCDNGADLIIGCHPHCLEPVEVIEGANGQRTLCYWSLGNFVSCQSSTLKATGGMAKVTLAKQGDECWIAGYELVPVVTHQASGTAFTTYPLSAYSDDLAAVNWSQSGTVGQIDDFCAEVLGEGYDRSAHVLRGGEVRSG